ncbi:glycosyltransferase family 1 protein [Ferrovibrio sp. MS7]|uniref:glycosyltransferase family 4 protein n=1 Tax=Ferrovibrio plantarum TaxID=3119164 RepID=UPI0031375B69
MNTETQKLTLLVDCMPMLSGGENGGAKWAAIGIVDSITAVHPEWRVIVMCRAMVADELRAALPNAEILIGLDSSGMHIAGLRLPRLRDGHRIDAILCPFVGPQIVHPDIPIVSVIYDVQFQYYPNFFALEDLHARARSVVDALGQSDRVICCSDATRSSLIDFYTYDAERIHAIQLRLADRLPGTTNGARHLAELGLKPRQYLLYPANAWLHKNHAMLLLAYTLYCRQAGEDSLTLVCTGTGPGHEMDIVKDGIERMGLAGKVLLPGFLDADKLAALFDDAFAMIFPSMFEGFGMPVLEAMQRGIPVLCSDLPPLRELAADAAVYFDHRKPDEIAAAILKLQADPALHAEMIERSHDRAQPYTDRLEMGRDFATVIADMVAARNAARPAGDTRLYEYGHAITPANPAEMEDLLGDGWAHSEPHGVWALGERSVLFVHANTVSSNVTLDLEFSPFLAPGQVGQRVGLFVNGKAQGEWLITRPGEAVSAEVPVHVWNIGRPTEITLLHPDYQSPSALGMSPDERRLSISLSRFSATLAPVSAIPEGTD